MVEAEKSKAKEKDLDRMTVKELKALAAEETDLAGIHAMKKAELLEALKEARGITEEKVPRKKVVGKKEVTVKQLKEKVKELKGTREEARRAKDKWMVGILRRKINRLKKTARKISRV